MYSYRAYCRGVADSRFIPLEIRAACGETLLARLRGYARWLPDDWRIIVLLDRDNDDCRTLKEELEEASATAGLRSRSQAEGVHWQIVNRIVVEELEAWYFGDWEAVRCAYPRAPVSVPRRAQYRDPDGITRTWETFEQILQRRGYFTTGLRKVEAARDIAFHLEPNRNRSASFNVFHGAVNDGLADLSRQAVESAHQGSESRPEWRQPLVPRNTARRTGRRPRLVRHRAPSGIRADRHERVRSSVSLLLYSAGISCCLPRAPVALPFIPRRKIRRDDGQVVFLGRADHVHLSIPVSAAMEEATVPAGILGIVLDQFSELDDCSHLTGCYHSLGPRHLSYRARQEEHALCGGVFDPFSDSTRSHGSGRLLTLRSRVAAM